MNEIIIKHKYAPWDLVCFMYEWEECKWCITSINYRWWVTYDYEWKKKLSSWCEITYPITFYYLNNFVRMWLFKEEDIIWLIK